MIADSIVKKIASPLSSMLHKTGFPILLGIFTSFLIVLKQSSFGSDSTLYDLFIDYLTFDISSNSAFNLIIIIAVTLSWYFFLTSTPLRFLNSEWINAVSALIIFLLALGVFLKNSNGLILITLIIWMSLLGLYKVLRGDHINLGLISNLGTAKFVEDFLSLKKLELISNDDSGSFLLGKILNKSSNRSDSFIRISGEYNGITFAKTGSGKGIGVIIPNLLFNKSSIVVLDIKAENFLKTVFARTQLGQEVYLIDPFFEVSHQVNAKIIKLQEAIINDTQNVEELTKALEYYQGLLPKVQKDGHYMKGINPMNIILKMYETKKYDAIFDEASVLANAIVIRTGQERDPHFDEKAVSLFRCGILLLVFCEMYEDTPKNLVEVRNLILEIFEYKDILQSVIVECKDTSLQFYQYLKDIPAEFLLIGKQERNSVLSTFQRHTSFITSPYAGASLSRTDCDLSNLKNKKITIFLVMPVDKLDAYSRLMRLWLDTLFQAVTYGTSSQKRILFLLDEIAQLGNMPSIARAISLMRGYGVNLWMVFQDIPQLKSIYGEKWQTFIANSKVQQYFGITDLETAKYLSEQLGQTTIIMESINATETEIEKGFLGNRSKNFSSSARALMHPDEIRRFTHQILIHEHSFPIRAKRISYFNDEYIKANINYPFVLPPKYKDL
ncbi:type IV secretory system conjugative DNA transfer family protein [Xanthocytophaga flava]|uniref:type IV secretory system conjugative DNA transfer family protein n=1 Tax=Xanthocytophaga flava TaxID=3048013 RepID=UPI0028D1A558|nr:type IV secretory system conjugative DNA transfer family protein [Xanthocytophaga flavus]MDJ1470341.1 type IV secretory system conjugative DNA transfer family protein [Xanthocytophaga flavus]